MKVLTNKKESDIKNIFLYIKYSSIVFILFLFSFLILIYPSYSTVGIKKGIFLCFEKVVPSLFPFMIISSFILKSELFKGLLNPLEKIHQKIFNLPKETIPIIFMSLIGGYPIGANMTNTLSEKNLLSKEDIKHLMIFCFNPSLPFCISYIGSTLYGNTKAGLIVYLSSVLPSVIVGIIYGIYKGPSIYKPDKTINDKNYTSLSTAFVESISESTNAIAGICATVIIFSCILKIIEVFNFNIITDMLISLMLEITNFAENNYLYVTIFTMSAAVSFGGICTHFQIMPYLLKMKIRYTHFILFRFINMIMAFAVSKALIYFFPSAVTVSSSLTHNTAISNGGITVSCTLIIMAVIIIFTDNALQKIKRTY